MARLSASSTNSGTRSSIPIFPRRLRAIPGLWDSTPAIKSSACCIAGKQWVVAASWYFGGQTSRRVASGMAEEDCKISPKTVLKYTKELAYYISRFLKALSSENKDANIGDAWQADEKFVTIEVDLSGSLR